MSSTETANASSKHTTSSLNKLTARLCSLKNDIEYYNRLKMHAQRALESHRGDLTLLQQKERAIFAAKEDELRLELHRVLQCNHKMLYQIEEARRSVYEEVRGELLATRTENSTRLNALQGEVDRLWRERLSLEHDLGRLEGETDKLKGTMQDDLEKQSYLHTKAQKARQDWIETVHRPVCSPLPSNGHAKDKLESVAVLKASTRSFSYPGASTRKHFIPTGPTILRERRATPWMRGNCRGGALRSSFSSRRTPDQWRDGISNSPVSHNLVSMVSTLERRNYLRPRTYLQRHGRDMEYEPSVLKITKNASFPLVHTVEATPPPRAVCYPQLNKVLTKSCTGSIPNSRAVEGSTHSSSVSEPLENKSRNSSLEQDLRRGQSDLPELPSHDQCYTKSSGSLTSGVVSKMPKERPLHAMCQKLKEEIARLKKSYAVFYTELSDPQCDSVAASQKMRELMRVIDGKANQLRILRSKKREGRQKLRIHHLMKEVERENNWCEQIYSGIMRLVRS